MKIQADNDQLRKENQSLEPYKAIVNVQTELESVRQKGREHITQVRAEADSIRHKAREEAQGIIHEAKGRIDYVDQQLRDIATIRGQADMEAETIVKQAREDAITWTESVDRAKQELGALQRKIDGYGREYLIPGVGLLDELAVDFGHTEAGQQLKAARTKVREMFKTREAAACDYVEKNRQDTATDFVADAFNGKVEEILSRVRHDNYGKLAQEIRDAAVLVNKNGEAFRNARINSRYVDARLDELKWATIVHELKVKEREEQKAIREQMREEEKVRKEIEKARKEAEKAQRDAEKEIEREQKIYEELKAKFATMSEKERAEAEAKHAHELAEIQERLRLAEEKGQRALSMAQQTKAGHVYVISNIGSFGENVYKIGMTRRLDPTERVDELGDASVPFPFDIHGMIHFDDAPTAESKLHRLFLMGQVNKTNFRKEFFRANLDDIKSAVEEIGGIANWTMLAEAAQYRETLRIEERIKEDEAYRKQWEERQK